MAPVTQTASGLDALRQRLADCPRAARTAAADALRQAAEGVADDLRAALPDAPLSELAVENDPDRTGVLLVLDLPGAPDIEFGTMTTPAQPFLRPIATAAGSGAQALAAAAIRRALAGDDP